MLSHAHNPVRPSQLVLSNQEKAAKRAPPHPEMGEVNAASFHTVIDRNNLEARVNCKLLTSASHYYAIKHCHGS